MARPPPARHRAHPRLARRSRAADGARAASASSGPSPSSRPARRSPRCSRRPNWPDSREPVLVVGHQPTLGAVASFLLSGEEAYWSVRKGAVWWLSNRDKRGAASASCCGRASAPISSELARSAPRPVSRSSRDRQRVTQLPSIRRAPWRAGARSADAPSASAPARRSGCARRDLSAMRGGVDRAPRMVEEHGEPQRQHAAREAADRRSAAAIFDRPPRQPSTSSARCLLLARREARHVGVLQDVRAVLVKPVCDTEKPVSCSSAAHSSRCAAAGSGARRRLARTAPRPSRRRAARARDRSGSASTNCSTVATRTVAPHRCGRGDRRARPGAARRRPD